MPTGDNSGDILWEAVGEIADLIDDGVIEAINDRRPDVLREGTLLPVGIGIS